MTDRPTMHCQLELEADLARREFIADATMFKWFNDRYSVSKHLLTLYSIARGLAAKNILEIGFGRSSFVLARAAFENEGRFTTCDMRDFSYLMTDAERSVTTFIHGASGDALRRCPPGVDFAFLDYFSDESLDWKFCMSEIKNCLALMKTNGIMAFHDVFVEKYVLSKVLRKLARKRHVEYSVLPYNYGLGVLRYTGPSKFGTLTEQFFKKPE